jgi:tetratricopeptide (TPR) repeat protein
MFNLDQFPLGEELGEKPTETKSDLQFRIQPEGAEIGLVVPEEKGEGALSRFEGEREGSVPSKDQRTAYTQKQLKSARILFDAREYDLACSLFERVKAKSPDLESCYWLGRCFYELEDDLRSLETFLQALRFVVEDNELVFQLYKYLGNVLLRLKDIDGAEEFYNKAYVMHPESDTLLVNRGTLEIQRGGWDRAKAHFQRALEFNHDNDRAWMGLALCHRSYGDLELAWANIVRSLDLAPFNVTALQTLTEWGVKDGRLQEVEHYLMRYHQRVPEDVSMALSLVKILFLREKVKGAMDLCSQLVAANSENLEAKTLLQVLCNHSEQGVV